MVQGVYILGVYYDFYEIALICFWFSDFPKSRGFALLMVFLPVIGSSKILTLLEFLFLSFFILLFGWIKGSWTVWLNFTYDLNLIIS